MRTALTSVSLMLLTGCGPLQALLDTEPAQLSIQSPPGPFWDKQLHPLDVRVLTDSGRELADERKQLTFSTVPTGVVNVSASGLQCLATGDASVVVSGAGLSATFAVQCRIVKSVQAPRSIELLVGEPDATFTPVAVGDNDTKLADAPFVVTSSDQNVVRHSSGRLTPKTVGRATVTVTSGDASATTEVVVMERIQTDTLALSDGQTIAYTLSRGRFLVDVQTRAADGASHGVEVSSTSPGCPAQAEATRHRLTCEVNDTASLVITNPTTFGLGPAQMGNIAIFRIP
jgi:hypothetical protein